MKKQVAFRLEENLLNKLKSIAIKEGRTYTWYVSKALNEYFDKNGKATEVSNEESNKD